jgi:stage V sporulation protein AE
VKNKNMEIFMQYLKVFAFGGFLCAIAQILIDKTKLTPARILVSFVVAGVILTAVGVYEPLVDYASSGATVPLTGFGYALAKGVQKAVSETGIIGALTGGLTATAAGIAAVILLGSSFSLVFSSKEK